MGLSFDAIVGAPVFGVFGVQAVFSIAGVQVPMTVLDRTRGVELAELNTGMMTVRPAIELRASEVAINGLILADLSKAILTLGGRVWRVEAVQERQSPFGPEDGRILLVLTGGKNA